MTIAVPAKVPVTTPVLTPLRSASVFTLRPSRANTTEKVVLW